MVMEKQPLVSVIVPIYNVEKYLKNCLDSLASQTYPNLEFILIDDGSKDSSGEIADAYAGKDLRFRVYHQVNAGLSAARNKGIELARGTYLTFVDSDDTVTPDYVEFMYDLLATHDFQAKLAMCSFNNVYLNTGAVKDLGNGEITTITGKQAIEMMCYHDLVDTCAYAKLGHRDLYENVRFPVGKLFEDIGTTYKLFAQCDKIECGFLPKYNYILRADSITTSKFNLKKLDLLEMTDEMANFVNAHYPELKKATLRRQVYSRFSMLNQMLETDIASDKRVEIIAFLKQHKRSILSDKRTPKRDRIAYLMLSLGLPVYRIAWRGYEKIKTRK